MYKDIPGYEGYYRASTEGFIISMKSLKILSPRKQGNYYKVALYKDGSFKNFSIHRLIAITFLSKPIGKDWVLHIDSDTSNNSLENLKWGTPKENSSQRDIEGKGFFYSNHPYKDKNPDDHPRSKSCICNNNQKKYGSIESTKFDGFDPSAVYRCCSGKRKTHKKFTFSFI